MKFLITGGCGFIGSNFINRLLSTYPQCQVINYDIITEVANEEYISKIYRSDSSRYTFVKGDLRDLSKLEDLINRHSDITHVIHFAAQSFVDKAFVDPLETLQVNVTGTLNLLRACEPLVINRSLQRFLHMSTDEVYGDETNEQSTENSRLCPTNPYSASKAAAEQYVTAWNYAYSLPMMIVRANNIYGMNQYHEKVIPKFIRRLLRNEVITIHGNGEQRRSFLYVDDLCDALFVILEKGVVGEVYNVASENEMSINKLVDHIISTVNSQRKIKDVNITHIRPELRVYDDSRYWINCDKLKSLGWSEKTSFLEGLSKTVHWCIGKKVLMYGSRGYIGSSLKFYLEQHGFTVVESKEIISQSSIQDVEKEIVEGGYKKIICCVGRTHSKECPNIDFLEDKLRLNVADNLFAPVALAEIANRLSLHLTYIGTGCIFDDPSGQRKYTEQDVPNFVGSSYSIVKGITDSIMMMPTFSRNVLNVRIRMPIDASSSDRNMINKLRTYKKVTPTANSVTIIPQCFPALVHFIDRETVGTINLVNPGTIHHSLILQLYKEIVDGDFQLPEEMNFEESKELLKKRSSCHLDTSKLKELCDECGINVPDVNIGIIEILKEMKRHQ